MLWRLCFFKRGGGSSLGGNCFFGWGQLLSAVVRESFLICSHINLLRLALYRCHFSKSVDFLQQSLRTLLVIDLLLFPTYHHL